MLNLGLFISPNHRHVLSLSNESLAFIVYPKSYELEEDFCTLIIDSNKLKNKKKQKSKTKKNKAKKTQEKQKHKNKKTSQIL